MFGCLICIIVLKLLTVFIKDLQDILDSSTQGVILLTFGTRLLVSTIPEEKLNIMMNAFAKIPQTVLMKYESELHNAPKNLIVRSWLPQRDVLDEYDSFVIDYRYKQTVQVNDFALDVRICCFIPVIVFK